MCWATRPAASSTTKSCRTRLSARASSKDGPGCAPAAMRPRSLLRVHPGAAGQGTPAPPAARCPAAGPKRRPPLPRPCPCPCPAASRPRTWRPLASRPSGWTACRQEPRLHAWAPGWTAHPSSLHAVCPWPQLCQGPLLPELPAQASGAGSGGYPPPPTPHPARAGVYGGGGCGGHPPALLHLRRPALHAPHRPAHGGGAHVRRVRHAARGARERGVV